MTPVLVTAPTGQPVTLGELKVHLRVTNDAEDDLIEAYAAAAVAYLDGWSGVLGRCLMPQTWQISATAGDVVLPMPDAASISAAYVAGATDLTPTATAGGPCVSITEDCDITFICGLPAHLMPLVKQAVNLLVGHWYENRVAVGDAKHEMPMALDAIITAIRWRRL